MKRPSAPSAAGSAHPTAPHHGKCSHGRHARPRRASARLLFALKSRATMLAMGATALLIGHSARANTADNVNLTATTDLDVASNYSLGTLPGTMNDMVFTSGTYTNTSFTLNTAPLSIGTLDDLDATQALTITGSQSITLNGGSDATAGSNASDLFYVASGGNLTLAGTGGLVLATSGNFDIVGTANISSVISGAGFGFTKTSAGTLTLSGTNTYSGGTTLSSGVLTVGNNSALGTGTLTLAGGLLSNSTGITLANKLNATGTTIVEAVGGNMTFSGVLSGAGTINIDGLGANANSVQFNDTLANFTGSILYNATSNDNLFFGNAIDTTAAFSLSGSTGAARDMRLTGNSVIGSLAGTGGRISGIGGNTILIVNQSSSTAFAGLITSGDATIGLTKTGTGTLSLTGSNVYTLATTVNQGVLKLDFSAAGAPATNIVNNSANSSALSLGGGTLSLIGKASTTDSQRFNGTSISGGGSAIVLNANATANPLSLSLGAITRTAGVGGTVDFTLPTGTQSSSNGITTTNTNNANGTLLDFTVGGTDWAAVSGGNIVSYTSNGGTYVTAGTTASAYTNANVDVTSSVSPGGAITPNTLRFNTAVPTTLGLLAGTTNVVSSGGVLVTSNVGSNNTMIAGGTLEGSSGGSLDIMQNSGGTLTIGSVIANDGSATGLNKSGPGTLVLSGANSYTGTTTVSGGTLQVGNGITSSVLGNAITLAGGTLLAKTTTGTSYGPITLTANSTIGDIGNTTFINDSNGINANGFTLTYAGNLNSVYGAVSGVGYNNSFSGQWATSSAISNAAQINIVSGVFFSIQSGDFGTGPVNISNSGTFAINGGVTESSKFTLNGGSGAGGLGVISAQNGSSTLNGTVALASGVSSISTLGNLTLSGVVSGSGSLEKDNYNTLTLTAANSYTGTTTVTGGTLALSMTAAAANSTLYSGVTANTLTLGGQPAAYGNQSNTSQLPTLSVTGAASTNNTQSFANTVASSGIDTITATPGSSGGIVLNLGAITETTGGLLNFTNNTPISAPSSTNEVTAVGTTLSNGILGAWATVGNANFATLNGSNQIVAYSSYTTTTNAIATGNTTNVSASGTALTVSSGTTDINALLATGSGPTLTIGSGNTLRFGPSGGILSTSGAFTIGTTNVGTITAGGSVIANNPGTLTINDQGGGNVTLNSIIANNGTGAVSLILNNSTNGSQNAINGSSTYSGGTTLLQGRWVLDATTGFGSGSVTILDGAEAYVNAANVANNFFIEGSGASEGDGSLRDQGNTITGKITLLADTTIDSQSTPANSVLTGQITGTGNLTINNVQGGSQGFTFSNTGTGANANNWIGNTVINAYVTQGAANQLTSGAGYGNVTVNNLLELGGFNLAVNGLSGTNTIQNTSTGAPALSIGNNNQSFVFGGKLTDGGTGKTLTLEKDGTGIVELTGTSNVYVGGTIVNSGTLQLGNSTALGATTGALTVNGSGVAAANTTASSSNTSTGGTLDLNNYSLSVGSLSGTGGVISSYNNTTASALTLTDTQAGNTSFAGSIQNGTATSLALTKAGAGTLDLTGTNTYTGATTISAGTLQIGGTGSVVNLPGVVFSGATAALQLGDSSGVMNLLLTGAISGATSTNSVEGGDAAANSSVTLSPTVTTTFANIFGGTGASGNNLNLFVAGTAPSILTALSTYTGSTQVSGGATLNLVGSISSSALTLNSGATLTGSGNNSTTGVVGSLTASGGSAITLTGAGGTALRSGGAISLGGTGTYGAGVYTTLNYTLAGAGAVESLNTPVILTLNSGGAYVNITNPTTTGTYTLATYASLSGSGSFSLSSTAPGVTSVSLGRNTETLTQNGTSLVLTIAGTPAPNVAYFNGAVSNVFNDVTTSATLVNFSTNKAGTTDAGNVPAINTDVILVADDATNASHRNTTNITATLGASTTINSLNAISAASSGLTSFTLAADGSTLTIAGLADSNTSSDGNYTGNAAGNGISLASGAAPLTINVPVVLGTAGANQSWTNNSGSLLTVGGTVTGSGSGAQTLTLANTSTGGMTLSGLIADGTTGTLALAINNTGSGLTTLSGANTYSGGTTLTAGSLQLSAAGTLGSTSGLLTVNGGTLDLHGTSQAVGNFTGGGGTILNSVAGAQTLTIGTGNGTGGVFTGVIEDNGGTGGTIGLIKAGTGTIELGGVNTYSGGTSLNAGVLQVNSASSLGNASGALTFGGSSTLEILTGYTTTRAFTISGTSGVVATINTDASQTLTDNGNISGGSATGGLTKIGTGTLNLGGSDTYSGITTVSAGTLQLGSATAIPTGNTVATGSNLVVSSGATLDLNGYNLSAGVTGSAPSGTGTITNIGGSTTSNLTLGAAFGGTLTDGVGSGTGSGVMSVTYNVNGTLSLGGTKTYTGGTIIALNTRFNNTSSTAVGSGLITVQNGGQWFQGAAVTNNFNITGNGTTNTDNPAYGAIRLAGQTETGTITLAADATFSSRGGPGTFQGQITGSSTTVGNIAANLKPSLYLYSGTVILDNTSLTNLNNWGGNTYINGYIGNTSGSSFEPTTLQLGANQQVPTTSSVTISNQAGTLDMHGFNDSIDALIGATGTSDVVDDLAAGASTLTVGSNNGSGTFGGVIKSTTGSLSLTKTGTGTETLSGQNTYTGTTTIAGGNLTVGVTDVAGTSGALGKNGNITFTGGTLQYGTGFTNDYSSRIVNSTTAPISIDPNGNTVVYASPLATSNTDGLSVVGSGGGTLALTGANLYTGTTTISGATLQIGNGGTTGSISTASPIVDNAIFAFNRSNTVTQGADFSAAAISGTGRVTQFGTGTTVLNAANSYTGVTTISAGVLSTGTTGVLANGGTTSSIGASSNAAANLVLDGGTLQYANTGAAETTDRLFTVTANGGALDASGTNPITFSNGGAIVASSTGISNLTLTGSNTGLNTLAASYVDNFGADTLTKSGTGTWQLTGKSFNSGLTTVNGGTLSLARAGSSPGVGGTLAGQGNVQVNGGGTLLLSANNSFSWNGSVGSTQETLNGGALSVANGVLQGQGASISSGTVSGMSVTGLGALTLTANSSLNFLGSSGTIVFDSFNPAGFTLNVTGANFATLTQTTGSSADGNDDRLIFDQDQASNLSNITFNGVADATEIQLDSDGNGGFYYEIEPNAVPEPATWAAGVLSLGALGFGVRRRVWRSASTRSSLGTVG